MQLARYLNRNYWEKKQEDARKSPTPSAPVPLAEPAAQPGEGHAVPASVEVGAALGLPSLCPGWGHQDGQRGSPTHSLAPSRPPSRRETLSL